MSIVMRIVQQFDAANEEQFLALERQFAALEASRRDYPKGRRLKPLAAALPCNTLIWECEFSDLNAAQAALSFFAGDGAHEKLLVQQKPFFRQVNVEFYERLDY